MWMLLVLSGQSPRVLLNFLQCAGQPTPHTAGQHTAQNVRHTESEKLKKETLIKGQRHYVHRHLSYYILMERQRLQKVKRKLELWLNLTIIY